MEHHEAAQARAAAAEKKAAEQKALEEQKAPEVISAAAEKLQAEKKAAPEHKTLEEQKFAESIADAAEKQVADDKLLSEQKAAEAIATGAEVEREQKSVEEEAELERAKSQETKNYRKIHVSNKVLARVFSDEFDTTNYTVFEVITVQDDGHRLLRSLSQSNVFSSMNPDLSGKVAEIRQVLHEYALNNPRIVCRILKMRRDVGKISTDPRYIQFLKNLLDEKKWAINI
jgi:hypothetical protein